MNKKELATVVLLILMIPVWLMIDARFVKPMFPEPPAPLATATPAPQATPSAANPEVTSSEVVLEAPAAVLPLPETQIEAQTLELTNAVFNVRVTNLGAGIRDGVQIQVFKALHHGLESAGWYAVEGWLISVEDRNGEAFARRHRPHRVTLEF